MKTDDLKELLGKVTPGPWWSTEMKNQFCVHPQDLPAAYQGRIADVIHWSADHTGHKRNPLRTEAGANARLIAMAPDLAAEVLRLRAEVERLTEAGAALALRLTHVVGKEDVVRRWDDLHALKGGSNG